MERPRALLLRGLSRDSRHWCDFPEILNQGELFSEIMYLDLPGFGRESHVDSPHKVNDIVDYVRGKYLLEDVKKTVLISMSFGGMVGISWASRYPKDFIGLVMINSSLPKLSLRIQRIAPRALVDLVKMFSTGDLEKREDLILSLTSNSSQNLKKYLPIFTTFQQEIEACKKNTLRQILAAKNVKIPDRLLIPLLCLTSKKDRLVNHSCSSAIANKYGGSLEVHQSAGHDLTLDDPEWVSSKICDWVKRCLGQ